MAGKKDNCENKDEKLTALQASVQIGDDEQHDRDEGIPYMPDRLVATAAKELTNNR